MTVPHFRRALITLVVVAAAPAAAAGTFVVTSDQPAFTEAARAAAQALPGATVIRADEAAKAAVAGADMVVVVGPLAERLVGGSLGPTGHAVAVLTMRASSLPASRSVSVPVAANVADVAGVLKAVIPSARRVAVFPASSGDGDATAGTLRSLGLEVILPKPAEPFAAAVDRLVAAADVVWIEDTSAVPAGGGALVVKKATDARKHVIGPNRATVLQGALFAVVPDPTIHGRTAGEAAARILRGEAVASIAPPEGRIVLNGALSRSLGVKLSQAMARRTDTVE